MGDIDYSSELSKLRNENEKLFNEIHLLKSKPRGKIGYTILFGGALLILNSIYFFSELSAYIGIALIFWGAILLYVSPIEYIRKEILNVSTIESILFIGKFLGELEYTGDPIYISPKSLWGLRNSVIIVPKKGYNQIPSDELLSNEDIFLYDHNIVKIAPPGLALSKYIEDEVKINFSSTDLTNLQSKLGNMLVKDLELVESFQFSTSENIIQIEIKGSIFFDILIELMKSNYLLHIGDPIVSALACIVARTTRKPVYIKEISVNQNEGLIKIILQIINV